MQEERLTDELLQELLDSTSPDAYLDKAELPDRTLADYLADLLRDRSMTRAEVIRASGVNATFAYHVFNGQRNIGRENAIMLAFGLRCTLRETQRLLRLAGVSELWCKVPRDAVIIFCIDRGKTRAECDDELFARGMDTLVRPETSGGHSS
mgnify:CR=1 FL=1